MTKDITQELLLAVSYSKNWSVDLVRKTFRKILSKVKQYRVDWDERAGEAWGVILNDTSTVAIVCTTLPIVFYRGDIINSLDTIFDYDIVIISVNSFDEKSLILKNGTIAQIFSIGDIDIDTSEKPFSVNDLYYSTV